MERKFFGRQELINKIVDYAILTILGVMAFFYSIYVYEFAEINIKLAFLNFPIFIGEIALLICLLLLIAKFIINRNSIKFKMRFYLIIAFFGFVIVKAFYGYFEWGPLAFRNAALFYYSLFAIIGYYSYRSNFFNNRFVKFSLLPIFFAMLSLEFSFKTFCFNYFILTLIYLIGIKKKTIRYLIITLFLIFCYKGIRITFIGGRDIFISSLLGYSFLFIFFLYYVIKLQFKYKKYIVLFITLLLLILPIYAWNTVDRAHIISLIHLDKSIAKFKEYLKIADTEKRNFKFSNPPVKIYEKSPPHISHSARLMEEYLGRPKTVDVQKIQPQPFSMPLTIEKQTIITALQQKSKEELIKIILKDKYPFITADEAQPQLQSQPTTTLEPTVQSVIQTSPPPTVMQNETILASAKEIAKEESPQQPQAQSAPPTELPGKLTTGFESQPMEGKEILASAKEIAKEESPQQPQAQSAPPTELPGKLTTEFKSQPIEGETIITALQQKSKEELIKIILRDKIQPIVNITTSDKSKNMPAKNYDRSLQSKQESIIFRLLIWKDMFEELFESKKIFGLDFGKPIRSKSIDVLNFDSSWRTRVGWVEPHNANIHILYRAGIVGLLFIVAVLSLFIKIAISFVKNLNIKGILLISIIIYWLVINNLAVIWELPYFAIPFWCLFGMVYRYCNG